MHIDWTSLSSHIFINPRYSDEERKRFNKIVESGSLYPGHLWVSTSGSNSIKWVGLSKEAVLNSAQAVNAHLQTDSTDIWIHALPDFHVGGLGIWARSYLSGSNVYDFKMDASKWNAPLFYQKVLEERVTLAALVPAQLYDIVQLQLRSPPSMRAMIIGGGHLSSEVYCEAIQLGWKVLPSYGLSECASQVATAELGSWERQEIPPLKLLPHFQVEEDGSGRLKLKGTSVLSCYAMCDGDMCEFIDPKVGGWFTSEDRAEIIQTNVDSYLRIAGRIDHLIKVGGESVDFSKLESILQNVRFNLKITHDMTLVDFPDKRLGKVIHLIAVNEAEEAVKTVIGQFNQQVLPHERIRHTHFMSQIPRSPLFKLLKSELFH